MATAGLTLLLPLCLATAAVAEPERPGIEWSTWVRLGYRGVTNHAEAGVARVTMPTPDVDREATGWEAGLGADLSIGIASGGDLRLGAWGEARTNTALVGGAELLIGAAPAKLDMFWYKGEGVLALRVGGNDDVLTGAVAYGYRAPWQLWGPWQGATRYMIGVRLVASATRARDDADDWTMSVGLEFEPIGAFRYLFGVRDWY